MVGGDLTLNMDSYSCPFDAICATVGDYMGYPAQYPEMHVYEAGEYIDTVFSSMHGYIEMDSLWSSNYDVDIAAFQIFISETGWGRGYHHTSAESLAPVTISAYDKFGDPTITGDVFLGNGNTGAWLGWIYSPPSFTVYATPGTYDVEVAEWYEGDYVLSEQSQSFPGVGSVVLDASQMTLDEITIDWDGFSIGDVYVPGLVSYWQVLAYLPDGHTVHISNPFSSYTLGAYPFIDDGLDTWDYFFTNCCEVTGSPGQINTFNIGGTFTTQLDAWSSSYYPGDTGNLETTVEDAYGHVLSGIYHWDADGSNPISIAGGPDRKSGIFHLDQREIPGTASLYHQGSDSASRPVEDLDQFAYNQLLPEYSVTDALGIPISGSLAYSYFGAPYEFDIPDPTNLGAWQGEVTVEFGPYQADGTDTVSFDVLTPPTSAPVADFDGDGDTDVSVFRPSNGRWYMMGQSSVSWALTGDLPVPGDYNGDGTTDIAVYRPSNGKWYIKDQGSTSWGFSGDIPVQADYDGDGSTEIAVLRPSNGRWYIEGMGNFSWYHSGDIPVPCDYDGDGADEIAVFRPSNNKWYVMGSSPVSWAQSGDIPVPADYDGDGSCDIAVYRTSNGNWYVQGNSPVSWGYPDDIPVPGDYDGDGATEIAILRPSNGRWYIQGVGNFSWYFPGDYPLPVRDTNADGDPYQ